MTVRTRGTGKSVLRTRFAPPVPLSIPVGSPIITSGLVLRLDATTYNTGLTWLDISGGGNNFTFTSNPNHTPGIGYFSFDGTDSSYVASADPPPPVITTSNPFSVFVWAWRDVDESPLRNGARYVFALGANTNRGLLNIMLQDDGTILAGGLDNEFSVPGFSVQAWHNVAITYDGETAKMYVDGLLVANAAKRWYFYTPSTAIVGGERFQLSHFHGRVADVAVYNRVLTDLEVSENYSLLAGRFA